MNTALDLTDPVLLTQQLVDIPSESRSEKAIADAVEEALRGLCLETVRIANTVGARTKRGLGRRVILAGHLDTVPAAGNIPATVEDGVIHGLGSVDMKSGDAVFLHALALLADSDELTADITAIFYECEEIAAQYSGLQKFIDAYPGWMDADFAILGEPTGGYVEAGCQGTIRMKLTARGTRAHSARAWLGENALHKLGPILTRIAADEPTGRDLTPLSRKLVLRKTPSPTRPSCSLTSGMPRIEPSRKRRRTCVPSLAVATPIMPKTSWTLNMMTCLLLPPPDFPIR